LSKPIQHPPPQPSPSEGEGAQRDSGPIRLPPHASGLKIGLFGGTFDPPHAAHLAASLLALKKLNLDRIWWLVTPGNPLKDTRGLQSLENRIAAARELTAHPRIDVTGLEASDVAHRHKNGHEYADQTDQETLGEREGPHLSRSVDWPESVGRQQPLKHQQRRRMDQHFEPDNVGRQVEERIARQR